MLLLENFSDEEHCEILARVSKYAMRGSPKHNNQPSYSIG